MLIEIKLLDKDDQYDITKVVKSLNIIQIKANIIGLKGEIVNILSSTMFLIINMTLTALTLISLKGNNQGSIVLAYNSVFYTCIKYIEI